MFVDLRSGVLPVNEVARDIIAVLESNAVMRTLDQLIPAVAGLPEYQRYAVLGPFMHEAVNLRDLILESVEKRLGRKAGGSGLVSSETWSELRALDYLLGAGEDPPIRLLRNKVYAHRHPVLHSTKTSQLGKQPSLFLRLFEARHQVLSEQTHEGLKRLSRLADDVCRQLLPYATWGRCEDSMLVALYHPASRTKEELERDVTEFENFFCLRVDPEILFKREAVTITVCVLP